MVVWCGEFSPVQNTLHGKGRQHHFPNPPYVFCVRDINRKYTSFSYFPTLYTLLIKIGNVSMYLYSIHDIVAAAVRMVCLFMMTENFPCTSLCFSSFFSNINQTSRVTTASVVAPAASRQGYTKKACNHNTQYNETFHSC